MTDKVTEHIGIARLDIYGVPANVTFTADFGRRKSLVPNRIKSNSIEFRDYPLCAEFGSAELKEHVEHRIAAAITKPFESNVSIEWEYEYEPLRWA